MRRGGGCCAVVGDAIAKSSDTVRVATVDESIQVCIADKRVSAIRMCKGSAVVEGRSHAE